MSVSSILMSWHCRPWTTAEEERPLRHLFGIISDRYKLFRSKVWAHSNPELVDSCGCKKKTQHRFRNLIYRKPFTGFKTTFESGGLPSFLATRYVARQTVDRPD